MGIREDFFIDVGCQMARGNIAPTTPDKDLLWAVKWGMERCLEIPGKTVVYKDEIRQLAKEME